MRPEGVRTANACRRTRRGPSPGTFPSSPAIQSAEARSAGEPGGRVGKSRVMASASATAPAASNAGGRPGSGAPCGDCNVSRATTSATPATSQASR